MKPKRTIDSIQYSFVPNHTATMEALAMSSLSGRDFRIVLLILRQTNGYLREEDQISPAFFARRTGLSKSNLSHAIKRLTHLQVISVKPGRPPTYSVNPPQRWKPEAFVQMDEPDSSKWTRTLVEMDEKQLRPIDNLKKTNYRDRSISLFSNNSQSKYTRGKYGHMVISSPGDLARIRGGEEHGDR